MCAHVYSPNTGEFLDDGRHIDELRNDDDSDIDDEDVDDGDQQYLLGGHLIDMDTLTPEQSIVVKTIKESALSARGELYVLDAPAGHGKSHVLKAIQQSFNDEQRKTNSLMRRLSMNIVMAATTGAAATLLPNARTAHTTFKLPLCELTADTTLGITRQSLLGKMLQSAGLIVIDEASMLTRHQLDAINRAMQVCQLRKICVYELAVYFVCRI